MKRKWTIELDWLSKCREDIMKEIVIDIMNETAEVKLETKGYTGMKCVDESKFIKDALGKEIEQTLHPIAYKKDKNDVRVYKSLCG